MADRSRARGPVGAVVVIVIGMLVAVLLVWPRAFGAQRLFGGAQLIAFRAPLALGLLLVAVVVGSVILLVHLRIVCTLVTGPDETIILAQRLTAHCDQMGISTTTSP